MNGIGNLFKKSMLTTKGVIGLLAAGNSCDAVILWRHLHELECVLIVLCTKGEDLFFRYIKHMEYFDMENNPRAEELQQRLSEECKAFGVKERNAFINYGWLEYVEGFREGFGKEYRSTLRTACRRSPGRAPAMPPMRARARSCILPPGWSPSATTSFINLPCSSCTARCATSSDRSRNMSCAIRAFPISQTNAMRMRAPSTDI